MSLFADTRIDGGMVHVDWVLLWADWLVFAKLIFNLVGAVLSLFYSSLHGVLLIVQTLIIHETRQLHAFAIHLLAGTWREDSITGL